MNSESYSVAWIRPKHQFVKYIDDNYELLHLTKYFGFTDFSKEVDEVNCELTCDIFYFDKNGIRHIIPRKNRAKYVGRELIIYNADDSIKFDEWVYIDVSKPFHNIFDINGYELTIGG